MPSGVYKRVLPPWNKGKKTGFNQKHSDKMKGMPSWNKGLTKDDHPSISRMGFIKGHEPYNWKGINAGDRSIHMWVDYKKGKASTHKCADCGKQARHWSNIDHKYRRVLDDYIPRCILCHRKYDKNLC